MDREVDVRGGVVNGFGNESPPPPRTPNDRVEHLVALAVTVGEAACRAARRGDTVTIVIPVEAGMTILDIAQAQRIVEKRLGPAAVLRFVAGPVIGKVTYALTLEQVDGGERYGVSVS